MSFKISNEVVGFKDEISFFLKLYNDNHLPNTILFQGLGGIGKYTFVLNLINSIIKNEKSFDLEYSLKNNQNILILNKDPNAKEYKFEEIKKIINFCKLKSIDTKSKFIVIKCINFLNKNCVNALLKLTEEVNKNVYFFFTSNFLFDNSKTLESRFFKKKLFLKKIYYKEIISKFFKYNNIKEPDYEINFNETPGDFIRKYIFNLSNNLENLRQENGDFFYRILSEKILQKYKYNHLDILKKTKLNLTLKNDISKLITDLS